MKVVCFDISGRGGIGHYIYGLCHSLSDAGVDIRLFTTRDTEMDYSDAPFPVKKVFRPHYNKRNHFVKGMVYARALGRMWSEMKKEKPDVVHWHEIKVPVLEHAVIRSLRKRGIRSVCTAHDVLNQERSHISGSLVRLYRSFDAVAVHAERSRKLLEERFGIPGSRIQTVPHGEYSFITRPLLDSGEARRALGLPKNARTVLFFGYIRKYKGLRFLIEAFEKVCKAVPDARLIIAGEPREDFDPYDRLIARTGLSERIVKDIRYIPLDEIPKFFSAADLVALPYTNSYQSGLLHLAFAYRRPVLVTDVGGLSEVVEEGRSGFVVAPGDRDQLSAALIRALSDMPRLSRMGQYAHDRSQATASWKDIAVRMTDVFRRAVA